MLYILILVYNEEGNIEQVISSTASKLLALGQPFQFVVVDDGSTDRTRAVLEQQQTRYPISIVSHERNLGVRAGFLHGFQHILDVAQEDDIVITKEGDTTSDPVVLQAFIDHIHACDVVLASCYMPGGEVKNTDWLKKFLSANANRLIKFFFPEIRHLHTFSSFYRAIRVGMLKKYFAHYHGRELEFNSFACVVEMLIKLKRVGARVVEIPFVLDALRRKGKSKMPKLKTIVDYCKIIIELRFRNKRHV